MKSRIFKTTISTLLILSIVILSSQAYAHPPQDMKLGYNTTTSTLDVTITHESPIPTAHYVYKVDIEKNGELYLSEQYTSQPSTTTFTYSYTVEADQDDILKATAFCNILGSISETLIVPNKDAPSTPDINGNTNGKPGIEYDYSFVATDPTNDNVYYFIQWGDGTDTGWIGPYASGEEVLKSHSWSSKGSYIITAKAKDVDENEGLLGTFDVTIPRIRSSHSQHIFKYVQKFFDRFSSFIKIFF